MLQRMLIRINKKRNGIIIATKQFIQTLAFLAMLAGFVFFVFGIVHTVANETDDIGRKGGVCLIIIGVLGFFAGVAGCYVSSIVG